jgi:hypothetical protein
MNGAYIYPLADAIGLTALRGAVVFHWPSILDRSVYTVYLFLHYTPNRVLGVSRSHDLGRPS